MDPITGLLAVQAASGIAQYLGSEKARKASAKERKDLAALLDRIQDPDFDFSQIAAPEFQVLQKYVPEVSDLVKEKAPELVRGDSQAAREGRDAQRALLRRYSALGQGGMDIATKAAQQEALADTNRAWRGRMGAIEEEMASRGLSGSGQDILMRAMANQGAQAESARQARAATAESYRNRLEALRGAADVGGKIRGEEVALEQHNTGLINDFNERTTRALNDYNRNRDDTGNRAALYNQGEAQRIAEKNLGTGYDAQTRQRDYLNNLKQQQYNNAINRHGAKAGIAGMARQDILGAQQDRNQAIGALGGMASGYIASRAAEEEEEKRRLGYSGSRGQSSLYSNYA